MLKNTHIPILKSDFIIEDFDGEQLLYSTEGSNAVYLNETARVIVSLCNGEMNIGAIIELLEQQYPASRDQIGGDINDAIMDLMDRGILQLSDD